MHLGLEQSSALVPQDHHHPPPHQCAKYQGGHAFSFLGETAGSRVPAISGPGGYMSTVGTVIVSSLGAFFFLFALLTSFKEKFIAK